MITANGGTVTLLGPATLSFVGSAGDPAMISALSIDEYTVDIIFAFAPQTSRAMDPTEYSISPALEVKSVLQMSPVWYRLTTGPQTIGQTYVVTWATH